MSVDAVPSSHRPSTRPAVPASPFLEWNHDQQTPSHAGFDAVIGVRATNRLGTGQTWKSLLAGRSRIGGEHQQLGLPRRRPHVYKRRACSPCACCWCRSRCQSDDSPHPVAPLIQEAPSCQTPNHNHSPCRHFAMDSTACSCLLYEDGHLYSLTGCVTCAASMKQYVAPGVLLLCSPFGWS